MAAAGRTENPDVNRSVIKEILLDRPYDFEFFQAVRLLERVEPERKPVGQLYTKPDEEAVHFGVHNSLAFPPSEIHDIQWNDDGPPRMVVNFMGLTGPLGVLPYCYTELIVERVRAKDRNLQAFLDIFNHRMISFFYQAWEKYRFPVAYERGGDNRDRFSHHFLDLIGMGTQGLQDRLAVADDTLIHYSGLLSLLPRSATALRNLLMDYFDVPVEIEQFAGSWCRLDQGSQSCLADGGGWPERLGVGTVLGDEIWDRQSRVRIRLGPLTLDQYLDFLPNGTAYEPLRALVKFFSNNELDFEVQLILERSQVPACELGLEDGTAPRLGWLTWIKTRLRTQDAADTVMSL
jgi:type VI secretion system protein ImpH